MGGPADLVKPDRTKRVGIIAKDVTYDIPAGGTKLVVRFEGLCTFWNEIMAFDNNRIHSGPLAVAKPTVAIKRDGENVVVDFTGVLQSTSVIGGVWTDVAGNPKSPYAIDKASQKSTLFLRTKNP